MQPPWIAFPMIPFGSIGWRMGDGEDYWKRFDAWYRQLQPVHRDRYAAEHPEPEGWSGFYARKNAYLESLKHARI
jgi:hypothetical protein